MKAQVSFEFMIVYAAILTIFLVIFVVFFGDNFNLFQIQESVAALRNAQTVAAAINFVYLAGNGASYDFTPTSMKNSENITISNYSVSSYRSNVTAGAPILDGKVNVSSINTSNNLITNNMGEIDIR